MGHLPHIYHWLCSQRWSGTLLVSSCMHTNYSHTCIYTLVPCCSHGQHNQHPCCTHTHTGSLASTVYPFTLLHFLAVSSFVTLPLTLLAESFFTETFVRVSTACTISVSLTLCTSEEREATDDALPKVTDTATISNILTDRINLTVPCKLTRTYSFKYSFSYAFNYSFSCFRWLPLIGTQTILTFACIPWCLITVMASTISILTAFKLTQVTLASTVNPFTLLHFLAVSSFVTLPLSVMAESIFTETFVRVSTA